MVITFRERDPSMSKLYRGNPFAKLDSRESGNKSNVKSKCPTNHEENKIEKSTRQKPNKFDDSEKIIRLTIV